MTEARFKPAEFKLATYQGDRTKPKFLTVKGWSDGTFGIDKRGCWDENCDRKRGYVVSHLRTGYAIFGVIGSRKLTESITKQLHSANWDFDTPKEVGPECAKAAQAARNSYQISVVAASDFDPAAYDEGQSHD